MERLHGWRPLERASLVGRPEHARQTISARPCPSLPANHHPCYKLVASEASHRSRNVTSHHPTTTALSRLSQLQSQSTQPLPKEAPTNRPKELPQRHHRSQRSFLLRTPRSCTCPTRVLPLASSLARPTYDGALHGNERLLARLYKLPLDTLCATSNDARQSLGPS